MDIIQKIQINHNIFLNNIFLESICFQLFRSSLIIREIKINIYLEPNEQ